LNHGLTDGSAAGRHSPGKVIDGNWINIVAVLVPTGPYLTRLVAKFQELGPSPGNTHVWPQIPAVMISEYDQAVIQNEAHFVPAEGIIGGLIFQVIPESRFVTYQQRDSSIPHLSQDIETRHPCDQTPINVFLRIAGNNTVNRLLPVNPLRAG
jgi:hypothetical protein